MHSQRVIITRFVFSVRIFTVIEWNKDFLAVVRRTNTEQHLHSVISCPGFTTIQNIKICVEISRSYLFELFILSV